MLTPAEAIRPESALVIVAHADDAEFGIAGTVSQWTAAGSRVAYVVCTNGDRGTADRGLTPAELAAMRQREQRDAAAVIGVTDITFLDYPDGGIEPDAALRRDLVRQIRQHRPEMVICNDPYRVFFPFVSHRDHRGVGQAALDAAAPLAGMPRVYPEMVAEGLAPHRVRSVLQMGSQFPDTWVDIGGVFDTKVESLMQHRSQVQDRATMETMTRQLAAHRTAFEEIALAEAFRHVVIDWDDLW